MLQVNDLAEFFRDLGNLVSEPVRASIVRRFCATVIGKLRQRDDTDGISHWCGGDQGRFVRECEIREGEHVVPSDIDLSATELAKYCNRWLVISAFRTSPESDWRPITPEMNSIRVTMIKELRAIAQQKFVEGDLTKPE